MGASLSNISSYSKLYMGLCLFHLLVWSPFYHLHRLPILFISLGLFALCLIRLFLIVSKITIYKKRTTALKLLYKFCVVSVFIGIIYFHGEFRGLETGMSLLSVLAPLKLLEGREARDFLTFIMISMFLFMTQLLSTDGLWVILYIVFVVIFLFYLTAQIRNVSDTSDFDESNSGSFSFNIRKTVFLIVLTLPFSMALFFVFPRISIGNIFMGPQSSIGITGFSHRLRPGEVSQLVSDPQLVFRVAFESKDSDEELSPVPISELYWRGRILSQNNGLNWDPSPSSARESVNLGRNFQVSSFKDYLEASSPSYYNYRVSMAKLEDAPIFHLENTFHYRSSGPGRIFEWEGDTFRFVPLNNQRGHFLLSYLNQNYQNEERINREVEMNERDRHRYTQFPYKEIEGTRFVDYFNRLEEKVHSKFNNDQFDKTDFLMSELIDDLAHRGFSYTLSPGLYNARDPLGGLEEFFFDRKVGFCEHYAAAFAFILRYFEIPTRVVIGFHGGEFNDFGNHYLVSSRDAHAWIEYWSDAKLQWTRFDPTSYIAPSRIERGAEYFLLGLQYPDQQIDEIYDGLQFSMLRRLRYQFDFYYFQLNQRFLGYNLESQMAILRSLGIHFSDDRAGRRLLIIVLSIISVAVSIVLGLILYIFRYRLYRLWYWVFGEALSPPKKLLVAYHGLIDRYEAAFLNNCESPSFSTLSPAEFALAVEPSIANSDDLFRLVKDLNELIYNPRTRGAGYKKQVYELELRLKRFKFNFNV